MFRLRKTMYSLSKRLTPSLQAEMPAGVSRLQSLLGRQSLLGKILDNLLEEGLQGTYKEICLL